MQTIQLNDGRIMTVQTRKDHTSSEVWVKLTFIKIFDDAREPKIKIISLRADEFKKLQEIVIEEDT